MAKFITPPSLSNLENVTDTRVLAKQVSQINHVVQANFSQLSKRLIKPRNIANEAVEQRHIATEVYAVVTDIAPVQMGTASAPGVALTLTRGDHVHLVQPVLYLQRSDVASLSGNTNNLALSDKTHTQQYVTATGAFNLTGLAGGVDGYSIILTNKGTNTITLTNEDALSTAANRFHFSGGASIPLLAGQSAFLVYDSTLARWREVAAGSGDITIGAPVIGGTVGSVLFIGAGSVVAQNNASLFWDNANLALNVTGTGVSGTKPSINLFANAGDANPGICFRPAPSGSFGTLSLLFGLGGANPVEERLTPGPNGTLNYSRLSTGPITFSITPSVDATANDIIIAMDLIGSHQNHAFLKAYGVGSGSSAQQWYCGYRGGTTGNLWAIGSSAGSDNQPNSASEFVFDVGGNFHINQINLSGGTVYLAANPAALTITGAAFTALNAAETNDVYFNFARAVQFTTGALIANMRSVLITPPIYSATAATQTITNAATLAISGAPVQGTNVTLTNKYALWVQAGLTQLDGTLALSAMTANRVVYTGTAGLLSSSANFTFDGTSVRIVQWLNVGTATDAGTQGSFAAGLVGAGHLFFSQSTQALTIYNSLGQVVVISRPWTGGSGLGAIYLAATPVDGNYSLLGDGLNTFLNSTSGGVIFFRQNNITVGQWSSLGSFVVGAAALAAAATDGFLYIAGTPTLPTGTPTAFTGRYPLTWNTGDKTYEVYDTFWRSISPLYSYDSADVSAADATTLVDTGMTVNLKASRIYQIKVMIFQTSASATAGIVLSLAGTCTATSFKWEAIAQAGTPLLGRATTVGGTVALAVATGDNYIEINGTLEVLAAGTLKVQFKQNVLDVANVVKVQRNSVMHLTQVG